MVNPRPADAPAPDIAAVQVAVRGLGARFDDEVLQATKALYAPFRQAVPAGVALRRDLAYGPDPRQRLDLYRPAGGAPAPLLLYVPGGGFTGGDKDGGDGVYGNVGAYFAARGWQVAVMNYRLAPAHAWPAGSEDVARAIDWLLQPGHAELGPTGASGPAAGLVAWGQSAGAAHLAGVVFDPRFAGAASRLRAALLMSGLYDPQAPLRPGPLAYYGDDDAAWPARSPLRGARPGHAPVLLSVAEFDPPDMARQTLQLADRLTALDGHCPPLLQHAGHNHVSTVLSVGTPQDDVGRALLGWLGAAAAPR
ncbi:alpha/beta hydrolase [Aquabacterium sp. J223]|uniref:alpha/beta hydrolase n=1 Tax=Aquabacterium sp. J223 TaxID=2898431 RepID=UPI0021ADE1E8|nr:alpha/beta hydrolase [Aquabacterium sp. J223]UUX95966.1 alpha/beta hydrolase [Aquabacterium sp. J223]